jgi:hypothetical protein
MQRHVHIRDKPRLGAVPLHQQLRLAPAAPDFAAWGFQNTCQREAVVIIHRGKKLDEVIKLLP